MRGNLGLMNILIAAKTQSKIALKQILTLKLGVTTVLNITQVYFVERLHCHLKVVLVDVRVLTTLTAIMFWKSFSKTF